MPPPPNAVLGRDAVIADVRTKLRTPGALVTLWGPGGIGKTTTAIAATSDLPGRTVFVALARATTETEAVRATADALGVELASEKRPYEKLGAALAARPDAVLVLDNLEQMEDAGAAFVSNVRRAAPKTTTLVTTREALTLRGEIVVEIPPLDEASAAALLRLRSAPAAIEDAIATRIAARLEGLPLAIELAAAKLEMLAPDDLLARLDDPLAVLRTSRRDVDPRHRALAQAIASSFELLTPDEAAVLVQLSTFAGTFEAADVEALVPRVSGRSPLDVLESLLRKSLVKRRRGERRFAILESIRAFCIDRLEPAAAERHTQWAAAQAKDLRRRLDGPDAGEAMAELVRRRDDLVAALRRADEAHAPEVAPLLEALVPLAVQRGPTATYVALVAPMEAKLGAYDPSVAGRILVAASHIVATDGERRRALGLATEAARILRSASAPSPRDLAAAELRIGNTQFGMAGYDEARAAYARARTFAAGEPALAGAVEASLAVTEHAAGNVHLARTHYAEAVRMFAEGKHVALEAKVLSNLAFLELDDGQVAAARRTFERARAMFERVLDERHVAVTDGYLGNVLRAEGKQREAAAAYVDAVARLRRVGDRLYGWVFTMDRGIALLLDDAPAEALGALEESVAGGLELEDAHLSGFASGYLVAALAMVGRKSDAIAAAEAARGRARGVAARALALHEIHLESKSVEESCAAIDADAAVVGGGEHVRIARVLALRALAKRAPPADAILVEPGATRVRLADGTLLDLGTHLTLARVLDALVDAHVKRPGETCLAAALVAAVWPGEKLTRGSGENRLRVAIAKLRSMGLRPVIEGRDGGYAIANGVMLVRVDAIPT